MPVDKTLLLKGVAGVAALGGVVGGGYFLNNALTKPPSKKEKLDEINKKLDTLGLGDCHFTENEITNVNDFSKECELDQTKLQKIKFSNKADSSNVTVSGLTTGVKIKLKIADNSGKVTYTFKDVKTKLTISGDTAKPNITLKASEEREFEDKNGKLTKVPVTSSDATKTKAVNENLKNLKIPNKCWFEEEEKDYSIECEVTKDELKKVEFENKETGDLTIETTLSENIKLGIRRLKNSDDHLEYDNQIKDDELRFTFKDTSSKITIKGKSNSDIVIPKKSNKELRIGASSNKLGNSYPQLNSLPVTWKISCTTSGSTDECSASENSIRVFDDSNLSTLKEVSTTGNVFTLNKDTDDYNLGYKFTVKTTVAASGNSPALNQNDTYEIKYSKSQKKWGFVKKDPAQ